MNIFMSSQFKTNSLLFNIVSPIILLISAFGGVAVEPSELIREYIQAGGVLPRNEKIAERIGQSELDFLPPLWNAFENESDMEALFTVAAIAAAKLSGEERDRLLIAIKKKIGFENLNPFTQDYFRKLINEEEIANHPNVKAVNTNKSGVEANSKGLSQDLPTRYVFQADNETEMSSSRRIWPLLFALFALLAVVILLLRAGKRKKKH